MIKALLRSEWIKFRSYSLALGAALVAMVAVPFFLMNLDYSQTAVGQTKALSEVLHALYLGAACHRHLYFSLFCPGVCQVWDANEFSNRIK